MPKLLIEGVNPRIDGDYDFDLESGFTNRELHTIKQISGLRVGEFQEAMTALDNDLLVAFALIALKRAGKDVPVDALWDAPSGKIMIDATDLDDAEGDAGPPETQPVSVGSGNGKNGLSSPVSSNDGDVSPETTQPPIGLPGLATGVISDPVTSVS